MRDDLKELKLKIETLTGLKLFIRRDNWIFIEFDNGRVKPVGVGTTLDDVYGRLDTVFSFLEELKIDKS